jgi:hypothetical protein
MIVKVQAPLFSTEAGDPVMVYDQSRATTWVIPLRDLPEKVTRSIPTLRPKVFWHVTREADDKLTWEHQAVWQDW